MSAENPLDRSIGQIIRDMGLDHRMIGGGYVEVAHVRTGLTVHVGHTAYVYADLIAPACEVASRPSFPVSA